jgi:hypothetical protein
MSVLHPIADSLARIATLRSILSGWPALGDHAHGCVSKALRRGSETTRCAICVASALHQLR